ncbi:MAG: NAD(P)/FAD-dependent oxidoreductase [Burkholderiaceae bacterium]
MSTAFLAPAPRANTPPAVPLGMDQLDADVVIIGGGPGGSTAGALLAQKGWRVLLLDKDRHPRFHIGESLLPLNLPLFEQLGCAPAIQQVGLVKHSVQFHSAEHQASQTFAFADAWDGVPKYAYQVRRSEFDHALLQHARGRGVEVVEACRARDVRLESEQVAVEATCDDGRAIVVSARYLVDATGRDTFMASRLGIKRRNPKHTSAALYGHFRGAKRNCGSAEGDIEIYWFAHGWMWFIPLADGTTSVGAVCWPYYLKTRDTDPSTFFLRTLQSCPLLWQRIKDATLIEPATATGNYSYSSDRMAGNRYVMVGDAFAFVDPVFSSGVYLAMNSARFAADVIDGALRDPSAAPRLNRAFERRVRRGLKTFTWMIYRMTSPIMRDLLMNPRDIFGVQRAVISFLAGDVYASGPVRRRVMVFRGIYYLSSLMDWRRAWVSVVSRRKAIQPQAICATDGSG